MNNKESRSHGPASLSDHAILKDLSANHLKYLEECAKVVTLKKEDTLFTTGKRAEGFFLIQSGRIFLQLYTEERGPQEIQSLGPGDLIGWSWLSAPHTWQYDAKAASDAAVYFFDGFEIKKRFDLDPQFRAVILEKFIVTIGDRLVAARKKILDLYHSSPPLK